MDKKIKTYLKSFVKKSGSESITAMNWHIIKKVILIARSVYPLSSSRWQIKSSHKVNVSFDFPVFFFFFFYSLFKCEVYG